MVLVINLMSRFARPPESIARGCEARSDLHNLDNRDCNSYMRVIQTLDPNNALITYVSEILQKNFDIIHRIVT